MSLSLPEHVDDVQPWISPAAYKAISIGLVVLLILGIVVVVGGMAILKNQEKSRKRFF